MNEIGIQAIKAVKADYNRKPRCLSCGDILVEDWNHLWYCIDCNYPVMEVGCYVEDEGFNSMIKEEYG